jgi:hypothetical protein
MNVPAEDRPANNPPRSNIDPQEVHGALNNMLQRAPGESSSGQPSPAPPAAATGSDQYPGSKPLEVKDANLPDIGIPTSKEVYTTSDSVATVISYYQQRYPEAEVTDIEGQKIIAVNRPGATKVIAIGTTGSETRVAIVQAAN